LGKRKEKYSYDAVVRAEIAIEILNQARAIVTPASMNSRIRTPKRRSAAPAGSHRGVGIARSG
jgi:hypothetical protein